MARLMRSPEIELDDLESLLINRDLATIDDLILRGAMTEGNREPRLQRRLRLHLPIHYGWTQMTTMTSRAFLMAMIPNVQFAYIHIREENSVYDYAAAMSSTKNVGAPIRCLL